jgi:hypothetical protein
MQALESCARERGLTEIIGYVLRENEEMGRLMLGRTYHAERDPDDAGVVRFIKQLHLPGAAGTPLKKEEMRTSAPSPS